MPRATPTTTPAKTEPAAKPKRVIGATRKAALKLLRREQGATLSELTRATGWQAHSARAVLTGLRKEGLTVTRCQWAPKFPQMWAFKIPYAGGSEGR